MARLALLLLLVFFVIGAVAFTQVTIFVIQPIGALPEGRTLVISRLTGTGFIDSADAVCERIQGGVSVMCRAVVLGQISKNSTIYMRLPYSETLYLYSTSGKTYQK